MRKASDILQVRKDYVPQSRDAESDTIFLRPFSLRLLKLNKNVQAFQSNKTNALFREIANMFKLAELIKLNDPI